MKDIFWVFILDIVTRFLKRNCTLLICLTLLKWTTGLTRLVQIRKDITK